MSEFLKLLCGMMNGSVSWQAISPSSSPCNFKHISEPSKSIFQKNTCWSGGNCLECHRAALKLVRGGEEENHQQPGPCVVIDPDLYFIFHDPHYTTLCTCGAFGR